MGLLTRDAILKAEDLKAETVPVPEWGGEVLVRGLRGSDKDSFEQGLFVNEKFSAANVRAKLVARCMVDAEGSRLFSDEEALALGEKSAVALDRVYEVAQRLSGIGKKEIEDAVKKSDPSPS
jgi:hypothetical protein